MKRKNYHFNYDIILDLHGKNLEDAVYELEKCIYSGNSESIMIIHGHGKGVLRNGIRSFLANCKYIKDTMYGEDLNIPGGSAITIVYL